MPNTFAYLMLFAWPLVALGLFRALPLEKALIWTMMAGYLILPSATSIPLPMLPALDKGFIPTLSALLLAWAFAPRAAFSQDGLVSPPPGRGRWLLYALLAVLFISPFLTALQNPEPIIVGPRFVKGLDLYDAFSMISGILVTVLPFFLGWRYLSTRSSHALLLRAFVFGALAYSVPVLFELRMSPQLHNWIYGFFPHTFMQHVRDGGFRPVVFLGHGLLIGMLFSLAVLAALTLWREALRQGKTASGWVFAIVWLFGILAVSKNFGALFITILLGLFVVFSGRRTQMLVAAIIGSVVILYPMLRGADLVPVDTIYAVAKSVNAERAESLKFRFDNEDALLAHANQKPVFGWGSWGRNQLFEAEQGKVISVTDGFWVITIGVYGWVGYLAQFGLLTLPILLYIRRGSEFGPPLVTPGLMIMLGACLIDLIPNAGLVPYVWLMSGALAGLALRRTADEPPVVSALDGAPSYGARHGVAAPSSWVMQDLAPLSPGASRGARRQARRNT